MSRYIPISILLFLSINSSQACPSAGAMQYKLFKLELGIKECSFLNNNLGEEQRFRSAEKQLQLIDEIRSDLIDKNCRIDKVQTDLILRYNDSLLNALRTFVVYNSGLFLTDIPLIPFNDVVDRFVSIDDYIYLYKNHGGYKYKNQLKSLILFFEDLLEVEAISKVSVSTFSQAREIIALLKGGKPIPY
ncbi:hypothetical protein OAQ84_01485 [Bdellovibrionales bacterium]|nr:hypothetical protein [Bdellovibrionales bacterium]